MRADALTKDHPLTQRIVVALHAQTLTIEDTTRTTGTASTKNASFKVGVGTPATPTPIGVTGYLQARYLDPAQGQSIHYSRMSASTASLTCSITAGVPASTLRRSSGSVFDGRTLNHQNGSS